MKNNVIHGDITTAVDGIIVHCCNCQGAYGAGVALAIRRRWPAAYQSYMRQFVIGLELGTVDMVNVSVNKDHNLIVANLMGQEFCGNTPGRVYVDYDAIRIGLATIAQTAFLFAPEIEIHYPMLGAGLAGGDWKIIKAIIDAELEGLNHKLWIYETDQHESYMRGLT